MRALIFASCTLFLSLASVALFAQTEEIRDSSTGSFFPREVTVTYEGKSYTLQATGVATRKKFFVKVYSVAHYLQKDAFPVNGDKFAEILTDGKAKQLTIKWVHKADAKKVQEGYLESFKNSLTAEEFTGLKSKIEQYAHFFAADVQKGDEHILRWFPGGTIEVVINGEKAGSITDPAFAKGLWSLWFGDKSVVDRNQLISLMN